jgi:hypothetical protein
MREREREREGGVELISDRERAVEPAVMAASEVGGGWVGFFFPVFFFFFFSD